jgi:hypothetical protein
MSGLRELTLNGRQAEFLGDIRVLHTSSFIESHALDELGKIAGRSNGGTATKRLESDVRDNLGVRVHADLELHHVAAGRSSHETRADIDISLW